MDKKVLELKRRPQYTQRTPEWHEIRVSMVTTSSDASLLFFLIHFYLQRKNFICK